MRRLGACRYQYRGWTRPGTRPEANTLMISAGPHAPQLRHVGFDLDLHCLPLCILQTLPVSLGYSSRVQPIAVSAAIDLRAVVRPLLFVPGGWRGWRHRAKRSRRERLTFAACMGSIQQQRYWWVFHDREEGGELVDNGRGGPAKAKG